MPRFVCVSLLLSICHVVPAEETQGARRFLTNPPLSDSAYALINDLATANRTRFYVYQDADSGFNHGFPSGFFGAISKVHLDTACVYDAAAPNGCSTDPKRLNRTRGTVMRVSFDPLSAGQFAGVNIEEPENYGVKLTGMGYDVRGATQVVFDAVSPTPGLKVQLAAGGPGHASAFFSIPQTWTQMSVDLSSLGLSAADLAQLHFLFTVVTNDINAPNGGTILLDNIRFEPVPDSQKSALGFPLANQVFGVVHVLDVQPGRVPIPPDQVVPNLTTIYESALAVLTLVKRGTSQDLQSARLISDTFVYALAHDNSGLPIPSAAGGFRGLHNGYFSGDIALFNDQGPGAGLKGEVRLAGFTAGTALCGASGFCLVLDGATGGNNAFVILALLASYRQFQNQTYLDAARNIGNWISGNLQDVSGTGYGGYYLGYPDMGKPKTLQTGKSVENNADIFIAFSALSDLERELGNNSAADQWTLRANIAGDFVMQMFEPNSGRFYAGTVPFGTAQSPGIVPNGPKKGNDVINTFDFLDAQTFTTLALAAAPRYRYQIDWRRPVQHILDQFAQYIFAGGQFYQGFDLVTQPEAASPNGIALEFTGQAVVAMKFVDSLYRQSQFELIADAYLDQIRKAQSSAPFADSRGLVASIMQNGEQLPPYEQYLSTPFQCIAERVGLAATTWAIFAEQNINPLNVNQPPAALSVSPKIGGGISRTFSFVLSDPNGYADIVMANVLINSVLDGRNACFLSYDRLSNALYLINDAGTGSTRVDLGSAATAQNSQCMVSGSGSLISGSANNLILNLAIVFKPAFEGLKTVYGYAQDILGTTSGFQQLGVWSVISVNLPPMAVSVSPNSGSGAAQTFSFLFSDPNGYADLARMNVLINSTLDGKNACFLSYDPLNMTVALVNDASTSSTPVRLGTADTAQNSQCRLDGSSSLASGSGSGVVLKLALTFVPSFAGAKNVYGYAVDSAGATPGFQQLGTWEVRNLAPAAISVSPSSGGGSGQTFSFVFSDPNGSADVARANVLINSALDGKNACFLSYDQPSNAIFLINDAGNGSTRVDPGSSTVVQNSQCIVSGSLSSVTPNGNMLTLNVALTFKPAFAGLKNVYGYVTDRGGLTSGFQMLGTWSVP